MADSAAKRYLGTLVYVDLDASGGIVLTTEDKWSAAIAGQAIEVTNRIVLDPETLDALVQWCHMNLPDTMYDAT